jgi:hypothetical protein
MMGRMRTRLGAAAVLLAALAAGAAALGDGGEREVTADAPASTPVPAAAADAVLRRTYMGVSCPVPNDISCDRVGVYAEVRDAARAVTAELAGRTLALDDPDWSASADHGVRVGFAGFLQPAGLGGPGPLSVAAHAPGGRWEGDPAVEVPVTFTITREDGTRVQTTTPVPLSPGWG